MYPRPDVICMNISVIKSYTYIRMWLWNLHQELHCHSLLQGVSYVFYCRPKYIFVLSKCIRCVIIANHWCQTTGSRKELLWQPLWLQQTDHVPPLFLTAFTFAQNGSAKEGENSGNIFLNFIPPFIDVAPLRHPFLVGEIQLKFWESSLPDWLSWELEMKPWDENIQAKLGPVTTGKFKHLCAEHFLFSLFARPGWFPGKFEPVTRDRGSRREEECVV